MCGSLPTTVRLEAGGGSVTRDGRSVYTIVSEKRLKCLSVAHPYRKSHLKVGSRPFSIRQGRVGNYGEMIIAHFVSRKLQLASFLWYRLRFSTLPRGRRCIDVMVSRICALNSWLYSSAAILLSFRFTVGWLFGLCRWVVGGKPSPLPLSSGLLLAKLFVYTQVRATTSDARLARRQITIASYF